MPEKTFWEKVESVPTLVIGEGPLIIQGKVVLPSIAEAKTALMRACNLRSDLVQRHLIDSPFKGRVLDLGCGQGANSIPLAAKQCSVTAVDKEPSVIEQYRINLTTLSTQRYSEPTLAQGDITNCEYPKDVDAIICIDVLPYLPPAKLREAMSKIFQAVRPGGKFIGTIFFKHPSRNDPLTEFMQKMGAHYYPSKDFAREVVIRSGFQILEEQVRVDGTNTSFQFVATKS